MLCCLRSVCSLRYGVGERLGRSWRSCGPCSLLSCVCARCVVLPVGRCRALPASLCVLCSAVVSRFLCALAGGSSAQQRSLLLCRSARAHVAPIRRARPPPAAARIWLRGSDASSGRRRQRHWTRASAAHHPPTATPTQLLAAPSNRSSAGRAQATHAWDEEGLTTDEVARSRLCAHRSPCAESTTRRPRRCARRTRVDRPLTEPAGLLSARPPSR